MMNVRNMVSRNSGREVANQFIISDGGKVLFQSYESPIVEINSDEKTVTVYRYYDFSKTTAKYRNQFMADNGFYDMDDKKGFEYYMTLGMYRDYKIVKAF